MPTAEDAAVISNLGFASPRRRLFDEVRRRLRVKHYSLRTEQAYLYWIRRHIQINGRRHPRELGGKEIEYFLSHLTKIRNYLDARSAFCSSSVNATLLRRYAGSTRSGATASPRS